MTDPREALAEALHDYLHDEGVFPTREDDEDWHRRMFSGQPLAERGVLLVTVPMLEAAEATVDMASFWVHESKEPDDPPDVHRMRFDHAGYMAAIFAALSAGESED